MPESESADSASRKGVERKGVIIFERFLAGYGWEVESSGTPAEMVYNVANLVWWDFQNIRPLSRQVTPQTDYTETLWNTSTLRNLIRGEYKVKIKYVIPGKTEATSEVEFTYIY